MDWKSISRILFALTFIGLGVIGFVSGAFAPIWVPVPEGTPARVLLIYASAIVALGCGAGMFVKRTAVVAGLVLTIALAVWTMVFKLPFIIRAPLVEGSYQSNGENWVFIAAAWVLTIGFAKDRAWLSSSASARLAYGLYGLALIAFGLSHFFYLELTAPLVPAWLPGPIFWAYATGVIYTVCGLSLVLGLAARLGAMGAALNIALITLLVWGPMALGGPLSAMHWQETVVSVALTAAAFVLASGSPPATDWRHFPSRSYR